MRLLHIHICLLLLWTAGPMFAADWPEWRGAGRRGVWEEAGALDGFPVGGLTYTWRAEVHGGFSGPAVSAGRVFVTDYQTREGMAGTERALAFDETTGRLLWSHAWPVDYAGLQPAYAIGPRATPTVDGSRVFVLGASGKLLCLDSRTGQPVWSKDLVRDYGLKLPPWGMAGAPLVHGERLIALVGGADGAAVVAFDKATGRERWRALSAEDPGYSAPIVIEAGGAQQLIVWLPKGVNALDPKSGRVLWQVPFETRMGMTIATPAAAGKRLVVSSFFDGSLMLDLEAKPPGASVLWRGQSQSEVETDGLHALMGTPILERDRLYGVCSYGQLRALDAGTGRRLWESQELTKEKARWASAFIVRHGDRFIANNDRGELVLFRLSPEGYRELGRTKLIDPTSPGGGQRDLGPVHWSHAAYANGHVVARNDRELVRAVVLPAAKVRRKERPR